MARRYTNYDHFCHICGRRIDDGEDYYRCSRDIDICIPCEEKYGMCGNCSLCNESIRLLKNGLECELDNSCDGKEEA